MIDNGGGGMEFVCGDPFVLSSLHYRGRSVVVVVVRAGQGQTRQGFSQPAIGSNSLPAARPFSARFLGHFSEWGKNWEKRRNRKEEGRANMEYGWMYCTEYGVVGKQWSGTVGLATISPLKDPQMWVSRALRNK